MNTTCNHSGAMQSVAQGADFISFFRWRTCTVGSENYWHGILDYDNEWDTEVDVWHRRVAEKSEKEIFVASELYHTPYDIVYLQKDSKRFNRVSGRGERLGKVTGMQHIELSGSGCGIYTEKKAKLMYTGEEAEGEQKLLAYGTAVYEVVLCFHVTQ